MGQNQFLTFSQDTAPDKTGHRFLLSLGFSSVPQSPPSKQSSPGELCLPEGDRGETEVVRRLSEDKLEITVSFTKSILANSTRLAPLWQQSGSPPFDRDGVFAYAFTRYGPHIS